MARDYAKQKNKRGKSASSKRRSSSARKGPAAPGWFWLVTGVVLGLFVAGLFYLKDHKALLSNLPHFANRHKQSAGRHHVAKTKKQQEHHVAAKPRFDFYTMLPKMKVSVDETNKSKSNGSATQKSLTAKSEHHDYVLQVASFKDYKAADTLKAKLILTGYNVAIKVSKNHGTTWHRVFIGPYQSKAEAMKARRDLKQQHLYGLVMQKN